MNLTAKLILGVFVLSLTGSVIGQGPAKGTLNWYNGKKFGMQTEKAYKKLLKDKKGETVIVGVIDSGVDIEHEDLKDIIWTNKDEVPNNGIDDDKNGYIDDVHGWNFLGNAKGENANDAQLEMTRIYARLDKKFAGKSESDIAEANKKDYEKYVEVKTLVEKEKQSAEMQMKQIAQMQQIVTALDEQFTKLYGEDYNTNDLKEAAKDPEMAQGANAMIQMKEMGMTSEYMEKGMEHFSSAVNFHYNKGFTKDRDIIGDNPSDFSDKNYGNNDVEGPDAMHGSHCSGIIAAIRNNGFGNNGVSDNVLIMPVRAVPNGDERDKDIALAIYYAVDNGAKVINMSFGKGYSENDEEVIKAIRYAESKDVLLVHAAGNSNQDNDLGGNYPTPVYPSMKKSQRFSNWLEVGASTRYKNRLAASFSNYGDEMVDVFAPGLEIYSTVPQSDYLSTQGTSMAAPMVAGVAALLKSYFPSLTMVEIKEIIKESVRDVSKMETPLPGEPSETKFTFKQKFKRLFKRKSEKSKKITPEKVPFGSLSNTGGIVNVFNAVKLAEEKTAN